MFFFQSKKYYYHTICGRARMYLTVSIDSLGYYEYNRRLYLELGLDMSSITTAFYKQQDQDKQRSTDQYMRTSLKKDGNFMHSTRG
jgi:hypothetical protein